MLLRNLLNMIVGIFRCCQENSVKQCNARLAVIFVANRKNRAHFYLLVERRNGTCGALRCRVFLAAMKNAFTLRNF